jgi:hypothetical protein
MILNKISKKFGLLIINLFISLFLTAQVKDIVRIDFPPRTETLPIEKEFVNDSIENYIILKPTLDAIGESYKIDSMTLKLYVALWNSQKNYLEDAKKGLKEFFRQMNCSKCVSEIRNVNNYKVLIINIDSKNSGYYLFFSVNKKNTAVLNGSLCYTSNKTKASETLNEILDNIAFKL